MSDNLIDQIPHRPNVNDLLGVEVVLVTPDKVVLRVEVGPKVHQQYGILHGGVSALLAEGAASIGGAVSVGPDHIVVGTELNCSHLRAMSSRSEERRVGKECRSRWSPYQSKKKKKSGGHAETRCTHVASTYAVSS